MLLAIQNPTQTGLNTDDEMFVFIFQFLDYEIGDENISLENTSLSTSVFDNIIGLNRKLIYETNLLGQQIKSIKNMPKLMIYNDGSVEKRVIID
jgi:hypothetical protein